MAADDLIVGYVAEVARSLPRRQRADIALELRGLLQEELAARVAANPSTNPDVAAHELLHSFGTPAEVAARYRETKTIIDPADRRSFIVASVVGVAVIWVLGIIALVRRPAGTADDFFLSLQKFWFGPGLQALWWPGFLVVCYSGATWVRQRWPRTAAATARAVERDRISRLLYALGAVAAAIGTAILIKPTVVLKPFPASPVAYTALAYDDEFWHWRAPVVLAVQLLNLALLVTVTVHGRWEPTTRRIAIGMSLVTGVVLAWCIVAGAIFQSTRTDQLVKAILTLLVAVSLVDAGVKLRRQRIRSLARLTAVPEHDPQ
jgi:hypothetical protein